MDPRIAKLQEKYASLFEITTSHGWMRIKSKKPITNNNPVINGPAFLDYNIETEGYDPGATLEDRSRNVWLRDSSEKGFQSASYSYGIGIWQVSEGGLPIAAGDLSDERQKMLAGWLKRIDDYVLKTLPELKELFK